MVIRQRDTEYKRRILCINFRITWI